MTSKTETIWQEFLREDGKFDFSRVTSDSLDGIRSRIIEGDLEGFITTDYREGWEIYARNAIYGMFMRYRTRNSGSRIRRFIPLLNERRIWCDTEEDATTVVKYDENRLTRAVEGAVALHGGGLVARGGYSWDQIRELVHDSTESAIGKATKHEKQQDTAA